jgi:hypothetical protein
VSSDEENSEAPESDQEEDILENTERLHQVIFFFLLVLHGR